VARAKTYLHAKFYLDAANRLATIQKRYRQTAQDRQWSDSIGQTVLQTVAQKSIIYAILQAVSSAGKN